MPTIIPSLSEKADLAGKSGGQTLIGGTGVTDKLVLQGTSGNGTSDAAAVEIDVGNNGATTALTVLNDGKVGIGVSPSAMVHIAGSSDLRQLLIVGDDTQTVNIFEVQNSAGIKAGINATGSYFVNNTIAFFEASTGVIKTDAEWQVEGFVVNRSQTVPAGTVKMRVRSTGSDTGNLTAWEDPVGNVIASVVPSGGAYFGSNVGVGTASPSSRCHVVKTTEQLRLGYDASYYASFTVSSAGNLTLTATGTTIYTDKIIENTVAGEGIILKSPDGTRYKLTVANGGTLSIAAA